MNLAPLADLCVVISSGGTPSRKRPDYFEQGDQGHPWVKSQELVDSTIRSTSERITDTGLAGSSAKYYPAGTVLVAMYGANVGQLGFLGIPATVNQAICGLCVDPNKADARYVYYALMQTRGSLIGQAAGAAQQNLNQDLIRRFLIPVPPLPIQRKVAAILRAYDELGENNIRRIKVLEEMAQRIYREWFVDFRYPGTDGQALTDSELGPIPSEWRVVRLGDVVEVNGRTAKNLDSFETIAYIDIASVERGWVRQRKELPVGRAPGRARRLVRDGDVIWSTVRPNLRAYALLLDPRPSCVVSTGFAVLSAKHIPMAFLYAMCMRDEFIEYLVNHATGSAYPAVTGRTFEQMPLLLPPEPLLERYSAAAEPAVRLAARLRDATDNLRVTRDLLAPGLISGEIDVESLDIATEDAAA